MQTRSKMISKAGGVTIPADIRRDYNAFLSGEAVDISIDDGKLVIAPHTPHCIFCSDIEDVIKFKGKHACRACISGLMKEAGCE